MFHEEKLVTELFCKINETAKGRRTLDQENVGFVPIVVGCCDLFLVLEGLIC